MLTNLEEYDEYRKEYRLVVEDIRKRTGYRPKSTHEDLDEGIFVMFRVLEDMTVKLRNMEMRIKELDRRTAGQIVFGSPQRHGLPPP